MMATATEKNGYHGNKLWHSHCDCNGNGKNKNHKNSFKMQRERHNFHYFGVVIKWVLDRIVMAMATEKMGLVATGGLFTLLCQLKVKTIDFLALLS